MELWVREADPRVAVLHASHTYGRAGSFVVRVLAFDDDGGMTTATRRLDVP
jgi:hypothetical protein